MLLRLLEPVNSIFRKLIISVDLTLFVGEIERAGFVHDADFDAR